MSIHAAQLLSYLSSTVREETRCWSWSSVVAASVANTPDAILGAAAPIVRGDINLLWAQWFVESLGDPSRYAEESGGYAHVFQDVKSALEHLSLHASSTELVELTRLLAGVLYEEARRRRLRGRGKIARETKEILWELSQPEPRCWICGMVFPEWAKHKFLGLDYDQPRARLFVDFLTGRGKRIRDDSIEIEHVMPVNTGGKEELGNLRLSCGFCNRYKSSHTNVYDVAGAPTQFQHPVLGRVSRPQPFWAVRLMAVRGCCEALGCGESRETQPLFIGLNIASGAANPVNLRVFCRRHDPLGPNRWVTARLFAG